MSVVSSQDIVFSLISGTAGIVRKEDQVYLYTQNYIKIKTDKNKEAGSRLQGGSSIK